MNVVLWMFLNGATHVYKFQADQNILIGIILQRCGRGFKPHKITIPLSMQLVALLVCTIRLVLA